MSLVRSELARLNPSVAERFRFLHAFGVWCINSLSRAAPGRDLFRSRFLMKKTKTFKAFNVKAESENRYRGIASVFGNIDSWGERMHNGAFEKTLKEGRPRFRHLWNHGFQSPPIASITEIKEVGRDELPAEVLEYAPEATGGLMVEREYYDGIELSDWVKTAIAAGDVTEMSFGYREIKTGQSIENEGTDQERKVHEIYEVRLFDTSDVLWGMNPATVTTGAKTAMREAMKMPLGLVAENLKIALETIPDGYSYDDAERQMLLQMSEFCTSALRGKKEFSFGTEAGEPKQKDFEPAEPKNNEPPSEPKPPAPDDLHDGEAGAKAALTRDFEVASLEFNLHFGE